ncbi:MAG TPA: hypothetical protein PLY19_03720 [Rhodoglobus sp.]|nr:hypothetical protein [Rhodoglobus sp.]
MVVVALTPAWDFAAWDTGVPDARLAVMIEDAMATATMHAPCLAGDVSEAVAASARAIIRGAVLRWAESGSGGLQSETFGSHSYTVDTRSTRYGMFFDREIAQLAELCGSSSDAVRMGWLG